MTRVTTVLLDVGLDDDLVAGLNERLAGVGGYAKPDRPYWELKDLTGADWGGIKVPEQLWGGAFKYFDMAAFSRVVCETPWEHPDSVQVMIYDEDNFRWRLFSLADLRDTSSEEG